MKIGAKKKKCIPKFITRVVHQRKITRAGLCFNGTKTKKKNNNNK